MFETDEASSAHERGSDAELACSGTDIDHGLDTAVFKPFRSSRGDRKRGPEEGSSVAQAAR
jgi:hypothetical protein